MDTDASSEGIGAVLSQMHEEEKKVVAKACPRRNGTTASPEHSFGEWSTSSIVQALSPWKEISHQIRQLSHRILDEDTVRLTRTDSMMDGQVACI